MPDEGLSPSMAPSEEPKTEEWFKYLIITTKGVAVVGYTPKSSDELFREAGQNGGRCCFRVAALAGPDGKAVGGMGNDATVMLHDLSFLVSQVWTDADRALVAQAEADAEPEPEPNAVDLRFGR